MKYRRAALLFSAVLSVPCAWGGDFFRRKAYAAVEEAILRAEPRSDADILGVFQKWDAVFIENGRAGPYGDGATEISWYAVVGENGEKGWMFGQDLRISPFLKEEADFFPSANLEGVPLGRFRAGEAVDVEAIEERPYPEDGRVYKIVSSTAGTKGFVDSSLVDISPGFTPLGETHNESNGISGSSVRLVFLKSIDGRSFLNGRFVTGMSAALLDLKAGNVCPVRTGRSFLFRDENVGFLGEIIFPLDCGPVSRYSLALAGASSPNFRVVPAERDWDPKIARTLDNKIKLWNSLKPYGKSKDLNQFGPPNVFRYKIPQGPTAVLRYRASSGREQAVVFFNGEPQSPGGVHTRLESVFVVNGASYFLFFQSHCFPCEGGAKALFRLDHDGKLVSMEMNDFR